MPSISLQECEAQACPVLLDSSVIIAAMRKPEAACFVAFCKIPPNLRWAGTAAFLELLHRHSVPAAERARTRRWLRDHSVKRLAFGEDADNIAGRLVEGDRYEPPDDKPLDLLHAALALATPAAFATLNRRHFESIPTLLLVRDFF